MRFKQRLNFIKPTVLLMMLAFSHASIAQNADGWTTDLNAAKIKAAQENKFILLNFSGSDWCGPCIKMKKDILSAPSFLKYASDHLLLVNADFPRMKKNKQDKALEQQNDKLADQYNKEGKFPFTLLLNKDMKIVKVWDGYPHFSQNEYSGISEQFTEQIKEIINTYAVH